MIKAAVIALAICCAGKSADAQMSAPPMRSSLPHASSIRLDNAAGALHYCVSKRLVSSTSADAIVEALAKKGLKTKSADFAAGASGRIIGDKTFSIGTAPGFLQSQACDLVLQRAKDFL